MPSPCPLPPQVHYSAALAAAFVEGWIFVLISISGMRGLMMELIPRSLMFATAAGIGCFLAFIGLQKSEGLALITYDGATLVALGGCPLDEQVRPLWGGHLQGGRLHYRPIWAGNAATTHAHACGTGYGPWSCMAKCPYRP